MKQYLNFILSALLLLVAACSSDKEVVPEIVIGDTGSSNVKINFKPGVSTSFSFSSTADWTIVNNNSADLSISPSSGKAGSQSVVIKPLTANKTNDNRSLSFQIKASNSTGYADSRTVTVSQPPVFKIRNLSYEVAPEGDEIEVVFTTELNINNGMVVMYGGDFADMWEDVVNDPEGRKSRAVKEQELKVTRGTGDQHIGTFTIVPNESDNVRNGIFALAAKEDPDNLQSEVMTVTQNPMSSASSTDFSRDGEVDTLQLHSQGKQGVPVVIMGDGFIDRDIESGRYDKAMQEAYKYLFSLEPMASLKNYFDVYTIKAVSLDNVISPATETAFSTEFDPAGSTLIKGDDKKCEAYAKKVITDEKRMDDALVLVILNDGRYAGTCNLGVVAPINGAPRGLSIAYIPMVDEKKYSISFEQVLHHEAIGHGLGKLDDEYGSESDYYEGNGSILDNAEALAEFRSFQTYFALLNVTLESEIEKAPWYDFYSDKNKYYASEELGVYEGASTFPKGAYRPTYESLMRSGKRLNVVGRSLIYKRVMNIVNGYDWKYDYDVFVKFDEPGRRETRAVSVERPSLEQRVRHARPVIHFRK